jgi:two-component sensor histidine kinase
MATFVELARAHTNLGGVALGHVQRLAAAAGLLADFCFSDLLLFAPVAKGKGSRFVVLAQIRPTTSQTLYREDLVGTIVDEAERQGVAHSWQRGEIVEDEVETTQGERARSQCIPVRWKGTMLGVLSRDSAPSVGRRPGELERVYTEIFDRFARMIAAGTFPFPVEDAEIEEAPRVGDGVLLLDADDRVEYASPNAVSALHRAGVHANASGMRLDELGFAGTTVRTARLGRMPVTDEVEVPAEEGTEEGEIIVLVRVIPLVEHDEVTGAVVLLRDVSELRRRDRLLVSKDATIREIHHRVKNNLQTISSLLRLQVRRLASPEAKDAIEESVRRIRSIALVHETLARDATEEVDFNSIVRPLVRTVAEGLSSPERPIHFQVEGDAGELPAEVATPLAVVLTELLQNTVDHAFPADRAQDGNVLVRLDHDDKELTVRVHDDGVGLPFGFALETSSGLGLSIVRSLVASELGGTIDMSSDGGTLVEVRVPLARRDRLEPATA